MCSQAEAQLYVLNQLHIFCRNVVGVCMHHSTIHISQYLTEYLFVPLGIGGSRTGKNLIGRPTTTVSPSSQGEAPW